jgi:anaerobic magnesium-protoporphyrin IX monomethyl ester cyclase
MRKDVPPDIKSILLFHIDRYYLVNQVYPFGLDLIAAALRTRGHEVEIACAFLPDPNWRKNVWEAISRFRPDVIGMGIRNMDTCMSCEPYGDHEAADYRTFYFLPEIREIASYIRQKAPHVPMVAGGGAFTVAPEAILKYLRLSYGIVGEGEAPFSRFVEAFPDKKKISAIPGMVYVCNGDFKVNPREPFTFDAFCSSGQRDPRFSWAYRATGVPVQVKRGCHHRCSYCVEPLIEGRKFVFRNIGGIIQEMKAMARTMEDAETIFFVDTEFNVPDLRYCTDVVTAILDEGLQDRFRFVTQLIPKPLNSNFVGRLAEARFSVVLSCESFSDDVLKQNCMAYKDEDIVRAIEAFSKAGIHCTVALIFGLPGETSETVAHTLARMKEYPAGPVRIYEYTVGGRIYQGTPLCEYVEREKPTDNLYGTPSGGYLAPYYFCSPYSPFEVEKLVKTAFPGLQCHDNRYDAETHQRLAIGYLCDQRLWDDAVGGFLNAKPSIQLGAYDYLLKQLVRVERWDDAKAISLAFLGNMEKMGSVDSGQADVARFYLSHLLTRA